MVLTKDSQLLDSSIATIKSSPSTFISRDLIPQIDLQNPESKSLIVNACKEFGFFKLTNHGIQTEIMTKIEHEAVKFFERSESEKNKAGPPDPYGYGIKRIGPNGDVGWIEYIFLNNKPEHFSDKTLAIFGENPEIFRSAVEQYMEAVKGMAYRVLEMITEGLNIEPKDALSKLIKDKDSDSSFRVNHYPECDDHEMHLKQKGDNLVGFSEHTDPQIISVLRSNSISGLEICLQDGTWVPVPADPLNFFVNVGDSLQVLTNGRFKSVKHRVLTDAKKARLSMVYFGGPPLHQKITPLANLLKKEENILYKEFTWYEFKKAAYKSKLADNRLQPFEKAS